MGTDTLRKLKQKFDEYYYFYIGEIKVARWRRYFPSFHYNSSLNYLDIKFYDCSAVTRHLTQKHLLDYQVNMYPKWRWLSWCGITIWFPYTWDEIKGKARDYFIGDDLKEFEEINDKLSKEMDLLKNEATELVYHADACAKFLRDKGFHGDADALESKYIKVGKRLGIYSKRKKPTAKITPTPNEEKPT